MVHVSHADASRTDGAWAGRDGGGYIICISGLVSASLDSVLHIWNVESKVSLQRTIQAEAVQSWAAKFSPDGKYVSTGSYNGQIHTYDVATGERVSSIQTGADFILCLAYASVISTESLNTPNMYIFSHRVVTGNTLLLEPKVVLSTFTMWKPINSPMHSLVCLHGVRSLTDGHAHIKFI